MAKKKNIGQDTIMTNEKHLILIQLCQETHQKVMSHSD